MNRSTLGSVLASAIKMLLIAVLKIIGITFVWLCKIAGMFLTKLGEGLEKIIVR